MRVVVDWIAVEMHYRAGIRSLMSIGKEYGVSDAGILKRAKKLEWTRDLKAKIKAKSSAVVTLAQIDEYAARGFVYVIYVDAGAERFYKIGMAGRIDSRMQEHQTSSPFEIKLAITYFVPNMRLEERILHAQFAGQCVRGEWFKLERADLDLIATRSLLI